MNIGAPWPDLVEAETRVRGMQSKLHQWAVAEPDRHFDDLYNLVYAPAFLAVAWDRVRSNRGARTAGVDGIVPRSIGTGAGEFIDGLQKSLKSRYAPTRMREKVIPKTTGKVRRLGIPTAADRGHGVSARTFSYLDHFTWWRIFGWLRKRHVGLNKGALVKRFLPCWEIRDSQVELFRPARMPITRYRFRGARIPTPWASDVA